MSRVSICTGSSAARLEEEGLLEEVQKALGLRQIIRICPSSEHDKVMAAARRLLLHADQIRASNAHLVGEQLAF